MQQIISDDKVPLLPLFSDNGAAILLLLLAVATYELLNRKQR